jgi:hypothetical protein
VASLPAIGADEACVEVEALAPTIAASPSRDVLTRLHDTLIQAAAACEGQLPDRVLALAAGAVETLDPAVVETLPTRPRVALRLLRAGRRSAAALVLADNATGVVSAPFRAATSSGAPRTDWRLPILPLIEDGRIFADLPGFRDPRFEAEDECYDITAAVRLRAHLDHARISGRGSRLRARYGSRLELAGWAAIDVVRSGPDERVRVVAVREGREESWPAMRHRRADLVTGTGEGLQRRAWAGWSAELNTATLGTKASSWTLWVEVDHVGLVRRTRLGTSLSELAARFAGEVWRPAHPMVRIEARKGGWVLAVS